MNRKKIVSLIVATAMVASLSITGIVYASSLQEINDEQSKVKTEMGALEEEAKKQKEEVDALEKKVSEKQAEVDKIESNIAATEANIAEIKSNMETQKNNLGERLRVMYKNGSVGFIDVILESHDISEFLSNVAMLQRIYKNDQKVMEDLEADHKAMEKEKEHLVAMEEEVKKAKAEVDKQSEEAKAKQKELQAQSNKLKAKYQELEAEAASILAFVQQTSSSSSSSSDTPSHVNGRLGWPVVGPITSGYGYRQDPTGYSGFFHEGIDIGVPQGTPIHAAEAGTVTFSGWRGAYGNCVIIDHGGGIVTLYGHNSGLAVSAGQTVSRGQTIAYCGSTGNSTGPHCHFTVFVNGSYVNPMGYL